MADSRTSDLSGPMRSGPPWGASRGHAAGGGRASAPELRGWLCRTPRIRRFGPESQPFSALLRPPSGSTPDPLATTLGVAFTGPVSRPARRPPRASLSLENPLARSGKPVGDFGAQRSFSVDELGSSRRPRPGPGVPLDKCSLPPTSPQPTHSGRPPINVSRPVTTSTPAATYTATPLRSPQFPMPLTVKKNLSKGTVGKTSQPYPFSILPLRGLPA